MEQLVCSVHSLLFVLMPTQEVLFIFNQQMIYHSMSKVCKGIIVYHGTDTHAWPATASLTHRCFEKEPYDKTQGFTDHQVVDGSLSLCVATWQACTVVFNFETACTAAHFHMLHDAP
jgi:hypothetical protein